MARLTTIWLGLCLMCTLLACAQKNLELSNAKGVKLIAINENFPLLKILLPNQPNTDRGIEVEFPEHVTGLNKQTNQVEHLYLVTRGNNNDRTLPKWKIESNRLVYETVLNGNMKMIATAQLDSDGVNYSYAITNSS